MHTSYMHHTWERLQMLGKGNELLEEDIGREVANDEGQ